MTSSCSVPSVGRIGIGRAADDRLVVYLRICEGSLDGATLYWPDDPNGKSLNGEEIFAEWTVSPGPDPLRAEWPLFGPGTDSVKATTRLNAVPKLPKNMAIYGWTDTNSASADGPWQFTKANLEAVRPGQVLVANNDGLETSPLNVAISREAFDAIDCSEYGPG